MAWHRRGAPTVKPPNKIKAAKISGAIKPAGTKAVKVSPGLFANKRKSSTVFRTMKPKKVSANPRTNYFGPHGQTSGRN